MYRPLLSDVQKALKLVRGVFDKTPLELNTILSKKHGASIYLKREDLSPVRSYKIRGALNKMSSVLGSKVVTCSAGNHAQGVAYACSRLGLTADIFMPKITSGQKVSKVSAFGGSSVSVFLQGANFDESYASALAHCSARELEFVHPFDDAKVIEGQATVGLEILDELSAVDYLILPVGGGGLSAGVSSVFRELSPRTKIIGVEPAGAPSLTNAFAKGRPFTLESINTFVDGASVKRVGDLNFPLLLFGLDSVLLVDEGHVCSKILQMYNESGIIIEPAGVLSLCAIDLLKGVIEGANVVSVVSGGNSDVFRMPEILERSLLYEGKKQYFRIEFAQKAGALKHFILNVLGPNDDIIYFRYIKHINKEFGPVLLGIETGSRAESLLLIERMTESGIIFQKLTDLNEV